MPRITAKTPITTTFDTLTMSVTRKVQQKMCKFLSRLALRLCITVAVIFNVVLYSLHATLPAADDVARIKNTYIMQSSAVDIDTDIMLNLWQPNMQNGRNDIDGTLMNISNAKPVVVAYAISLFKCGDHQSTAAGLIDGAIVLRHSVHLTSIRNPDSGSKYDYKTYAIVHRDAAPCSHILRDVGYQIMLVDIPVTIKEIQSEYLRKNIHFDGCCGEVELIKLYAYTLLDHPIVVHVDVDFLFRLPMDDLFDAMLSSSTSPEGIQARSRIPMERPGTDMLPDKIDFYMVRDWAINLSGRKSGLQGGLMILRPDMNTFNTIIEVVRNEEYVPGFSRKNGWGGKGYGFPIWGAMTIQGLIVYIYDEILRNSSVELDHCRFNHMGASVFEMSIFRLIPCRSGVEGCKQCSRTNVSDLYSIHHTACMKPWSCSGEYSYSNLFTVINQLYTNFNHCMEVQNVWHAIRTDFELKMLSLTGDATINTGRIGSYKRNIFHGHCKAHGMEHYLNISGNQITLQRINSLYGDSL